MELGMEVEEGGGGGVDWGRGEGGCHVSMWKKISDQCKKCWVGIANGPKNIFTVGSVNFFLTPSPPPPSKCPVIKRHNDQLIVNRLI